MVRRLALAAVVLALALCGPALAGTTAEIKITVTVEYLSVKVTQTTVKLGTVAAGTTPISSKVDIENDGNVAENIGLKITNQDDLGVWTAEKKAGENQYVLYGIIVNDSFPAPTQADCQTDADDLSASVKYWQTTDGTAATSAFVTTVGTATPVPAGVLKDLYFGFAVPTSVTGPTARLEHAITVELSVYKD